jgi:hypothetical protein
MSLPGGNSFESRYYLGNASLPRRLWRDLRIVGSSARFLWLWLTLGGRMRRALRAAEREQRVLHLEDLVGGDNR